MIHQMILTVRVQTGCRFKLPVNDVLKVKPAKRGKHTLLECRTGGQHSSAKKARQGGLLSTEPYAEVLARVTKLRAQQAAMA